MIQTISTDVLATKIASNNIHLIDVREAHEFSNGHLPNAINLPLSTLETTYTQLDPTKNYIIICKMGMRSQKACQFLEEKGLHVTHVQGGLDAWKGQLLP